MHDETWPQDPLTGAYSRAGFSRQLGDAVDRARQSGGPCSVLVIDLDHFKSVNDAFGHARGDEVLVELVARLQRITRSDERLFRYGGDEFVLIAPTADAEEAQRLARRLLGTVRDQPFGGSPPLALSLSIGVATYPVDADSAGGLFDVADRRAAEAKRRGRGRIVGDADGRAHLLTFESVSRLVDRDDELARFHAFLDALAPRGRGVFTIGGALGSGRSTFLAQVAGAAEIRGFFTIRLRGTRRLASRHFGALDEALSASDLPSVPTDSVSARRDSLARLLVERGAVFFAVDDAALLDEATADVIRGLLETDGDGRFAVALPEDGEAGRGVSLTAAVVRRVDLRPLSRTGLRSWLRTLLQTEPPIGVVDWLHRETGGLPGAVREVLSELADNAVLYRDETGSWTFTGGFPAQAGAPAGERRESETPNNLPVATMSPILGRASALAEVGAALRPYRLVTLTGPGGIGKSRLALEIARRAMPAFPDGVWFVSLASVRDSSLVVSSIAQVLGLVDVIGTPAFAQLREYLRNRRLLLVLDNFEQVIDAAPAVAELIGQSPRVHALVTSREVLHVEGEFPFPVAPLALPPIGGGDRPEPNEAERALSPAETLFVERATAANPRLVINAAEARAVAEICRRLDGLPLAIELAAARSSVFSPRSLLARLDAADPGDARLDLLATPVLDRPERLQTLRAAISWSYDLLAEDERRLFRAAAVFPGGATLAALEAVVGDDPNSRPVDVLVESLVGKSLLGHAPDAGPELRFVMLETIRQFAQSALRSSGEAPAANHRHAEHTLREAEARRPQLDVGDRTQTIAWFDREHPNIRAALDWLLEQPDPIPALRLLATVWRFWRYAGHFGEGRRWLERGLAIAGPVAELSGERASLVAAVLLGAGNLAFLQSDFGVALARLDAAVDLGRRSGNLAATAHALALLGTVANARGDYETSRAQLDASIALFESLRDEAGLALAYFLLSGPLISTGEFSVVRAALAQSLARFDRLGDRWGVGLAVGAFALAATRQGDLDEALRWHERAHAMIDEVNDRWFAAQVVRNLAEARLLRGDLDDATCMARVAVERHAALGNERGTAQTRLVLALALARNGDVGAARGELIDTLHGALAARDAILVAQGVFLTAWLIVKAAPPEEADEARTARAAALYRVGRRLFGDRRAFHNLTAPEEASVAARVPAELASAPLPDSPDLDSVVTEALACLWEYIGSVAPRTTH